MIGIKPGYNEDGSRISDRDKPSKDKDKDKDKRMGEMLDDEKGDVSVLDKDKDKNRSVDAVLKAGGSSMIPSDDNVLE